MSERPRRFQFGFRTRLGLIITAVFVLAGAGLLLAQFIVVQQLFASAVRVTISCSHDDSSVVAPEPSGRATEIEQGHPDDDTPTDCPSDGPVAGAGGESDDSAYSSVLQQSVFLSEAVIGGLVGWSIALLVAFAFIAAAIAFRLARHSLDRIGEVTKAARDISERDLQRRLDLPGPDDEIKELGDTFDGMLDRLSLAFTAQDRFIANASHELRTPLTTARAALEIPLSQGTVPTELEPAITRALRATEQSERLVSALLSLARGRAGLDDVAVVDLAGVAAASVAEAMPDADARGITIESDLDETIVTGDATLLGRAIDNLLDNAVRHNVPDGHVTLRVHSGQADGHATVEIENTGAVLDDADVALLTEPFYRGAASRTGSGLGLGLAIVDSIATAHGGRLRLAGRTGGGLVAKLELPLTPR